MVPFFKAFKQNNGIFLMQKKVHAKQLIKKQGNHNLGIVVTSG